MPPEYWDWDYWVRQLVNRKPFVIGSGDVPYLLRWYLIPRNPYLNVYLHKFLRSDEDRALHDHPWWFVSMVLKGSYWEHREGKVKQRQEGSIAIRPASTLHRVELNADGPMPGSHVIAEQPCWTLIATGPKVREWGFKCPKGWVHWKEFTHKNGCGEYA